MTLTSSAPLTGEADVLTDLMTGERLVGTGRFFAAFCVVFGTGILLMRECMILPSLAVERYRFTRHGRSAGEGGLRADPLVLTTLADVGHGAQGVSARRARRGTTPWQPPTFPGTMRNAPK